MTVGRGGMGPSVSARLRGEREVGAGAGLANGVQLLKTKWRFTALLSPAGQIAPPRKQVDSRA